MRKEAPNDAHQRRHRHQASKDVITIAPDATVRELLSLLAEHNVGALIVSADGSSVDGIVSERDVVRRLVDSDDVLDGAVSAIMTADVQTAIRTPPRRAGGS